MKRMALLLAVGWLAAIPSVWAAGRPPAETCVNAGYRMGTQAFDQCVQRLTGDDPLSGLEDADMNDADLDDARGDPATDRVAPVDGNKIPVPPGGWNSTSPPHWDFTVE